jgi:hypothetical protein
MKDIEKTLDDMLKSLSQIALEVKKMKRELKPKQATMVPAVPPKDFDGTPEIWKTALVERGLYNEDENKSLFDVLIPEDDWIEIVEECETRGTGEKDE